MGALFGLRYFAHLAHRQFWKGWAEKGEKARERGRPE